MRGSSAGPLLVCSEYSLGWGTASPEQLVARAAELGLRSLGLCDVGTLAGQMRFHAACKAANIQPITGVQLGGVSLIARDREGYRSLCEAVSRQDPSYRPGLLALSPTPLEGWPAGSVHWWNPPSVVMAAPEEHDLHVLLLAVRQKLSLTEARRRAAPAGAFLQPDPGAAALAERCTLDLSHNPPLLPHPDDAELRRRCEPLNARLQLELREIERRGLSGYFLRVADLAREAVRRGIPFCARGSAVGSLVAFRLGLTPLDPEQHGLYFERFLHAHRAELPDIDLDFASERRDELLSWLFRAYPHQVAMVGVHQTYQLRGALRAGLKALGMPAAEVEHFCRRLPDPELEAPVPGDLLLPRYRAQLPLLLRLVGKPSHLSVHPGGVFFTPPPVESYAPTFRAPKGVLTCQYDMASCERAGLVKIDLLGNRFLSELADVGIVVRTADDPATLATLDRADTLGCFQLETPAMRDVLRRLPIRRFADVVTALALVRPGPGAGTAKATFLRRARGERAAPAPDPKLQGRLANTYGLPLFEEDIMTMLAVLGEVSLAKAEAWREAIGRGEEVPAGIPEPAATLIRRFAAYSFNKAHASSYAWLAYQAAFLKTHHTGPFAAALLNHHAGVYPLRTLVADLQRHGIRFVPPDVNHSAERSEWRDGEVFVGLDQVKFLTARSRAALLASRPFTRMDDLPSLGKRELEALVWCGACDGLWPLRADLYPYAQEVWLQGVRSPVTGLQVEDSPERVRLYQRLARVQRELETLGMHLSDHPLALLRPEARRLGCVSLREVGEGRVRVVALVCASRRVPRRTGEPLHFVTLEDESGLLEAVVTPPVYSRLGNPIQTPGPYLLEGELVGEGRLSVGSVLPFHQRNRES